jgi:hypothetical protein
MNKVDNNILLIMDDCQPSNLYIKNNKFAKLFMKGRHSTIFNMPWLYEWSTPYYTNNISSEQNIKKKRKQKTNNRNKRKYTNVKKATEITIEI